MKTIFVAVALVIAAPAAAQPADQHQGHAQHQSQGQDQHQGHAQHQGQGQGDHSQHQQGQQGEHREGCCADRNGNGRADCCEQDGQRASCCADHEAHGGHAARPTGR